MPKTLRFRLGRPDEYAKFQMMMYEWAKQRLVIKVENVVEDDEERVAIQVEGSETESDFDGMYPAY